MKDAVEMIFGEMPHFHTVEFLPGEGYESLTQKLEELAHDKGFTPEQTLIVADLFSGSPYNASATLALKGEVSDVIAGMSLPICLVLAVQAATGQQNTSAAVAAVADQAQTFTRILSRQTQNEEDEDLS